MCATKAVLLGPALVGRAPVHLSGSQPTSFLGSGSRPAHGSRGDPRGTFAWHPLERRHGWDGRPLGTSLRCQKLGWGTLEQV